MASQGPDSKRSKITGEPETKGTTDIFTLETLVHLLYGKNENQPIDVENLKHHAEKSKTYCDKCSTPSGCSLHELSKTADQEEQGLSYAVKSFPPEVQLCTSTIPGARYGVCAKRKIPEGTWIGPYEGKRVKPEDMPSNLDNSYVWEIYEDGQASCYIDGTDESASSWMRFVRCARNKNEQNLYAFQYLGNVFYRSFKDIPAGTEMLVWYDDKYPQYMGIPTGLQEIEFVHDIDHNTKSSSTDQVDKSDQKREHDNFKLHRNVKVQSVTPSPRSTTSKHAPDHQTRIQSREYPWGSRDVPSLGPLAPLPVNISTGIPSQRIMGKISGGIHPGITGTLDPRDKPLDPSIALPYLYDNHSVKSSVSANTEWLPFSRSGNPYPEAHAHLYSMPSIQSSDSTSQVLTVCGVSSYPIVTVVSANSEVRSSSREPRKGGRLSYLPYHQVTEEDLRERGYINLPCSSTRPVRRQQSPPRMEMWKDEDNSELKEISEQTTTDCESTGSSSKDVGPSFDSNGGKETDVAIDEISMWRCRQCQKTFTQRVQLQIHVCPNEPFKPYRCGQCELSFDSAPELRSHVDTHASEKPFKCGFCSRSFAGATTLNNHIRTHMGKRPFSCECGKSFAQAGQLARHQRTPGECQHAGQQKNS